MAAHRMVVRHCTAASSAPPPAPQMAGPGLRMAWPWDGAQRCPTVTPCAGVTPAPEPAPSRLPARWSHRRPLQPWRRPARRAGVLPRRTADLQDSCRLHAHGVLHNAISW